MHFEQAPQTITQTPQPTPHTPLLTLLAHFHSHTQTICQHMFSEYHTGVLDMLDGFG